jgi:hypothetical protein
MSEAPRVTHFADTSEGREALRQWLLERFGPRVEFRPTWRGVELRAADAPEVRQ